MGIAANQQKGSSTMAEHFYLMPVIGTQTQDDPRRAKYSIPSVAGRMMDYGLEPVCLFASDVTEARHAELIAHADVTEIPQNLETQVGGNLARLQAILDGYNIPNDWITSTTTYKQVFRAVATLFQVMQKFHHGSLERLFKTGITLDTRMNQLPGAARNTLQEAVEKTGLDPAELKGTNTLKAALKNIATQGKESSHLGSDEVF